VSASFSRNPFAAIGANDDDDDAAAAAPAANDGARALDNNRYGVIDKRSENLQHCQWHHTDPLWRSSLSIDARSVSATRWRRLLTTSPIPF
jgi:hypothetical protein